MQGTSCSKPLSFTACSTVVPAGTLNERRKALSGTAWHICTWMLASAIDGLRALAEGIDHAVGDHAEHGADDLFQHPAGKLVVQVQFNLAGVVAQGFEGPDAVKGLERTVDQLHLDR